MDCMAMYPQGSGDGGLVHPCFAQSTDDRKRIRIRALVRSREVSRSGLRRVSCRLRNQSLKRIKARAGVREDLESRSRSS